MGFLDDKQAMIEDYFRTMDHLADERDVFRAKCREQRKTMQCEQLKSMLRCALAILAAQVSFSPPGRFAHPTR